MDRDSYKEEVNKVEKSSTPGQEENPYTPGHEGKSFTSGQDAPKQDTANRERDATTTGRLKFTKSSWVLL